MKTILIIASLDHSASQERAETIQEILKKNNFPVTVVDDYKLFVHLLKLNFFIRSPLFFLGYLSQNLLYKFKLRQYPLWAEMKLRGSIIKKIIKKNSPDVVICQNPQDIICLTDQKNIFTVYDAPTIFYKEIQTENLYSRNDIQKIKSVEKNILKKVDMVSFHWHTFFDLAQKNHLQIHNPILANWSCPTTSSKPFSHQKNKIVHIGKLNSNWVNPQLLEKLQKQSQIPIDIFSYEKPDSRYTSLHTTGYLKNIKKISQYKFGLITIFDNELRNNGFSAKHLTYIAYGLPVLCPQWRQDKLLSPATIYYNEKNFNQQIKKYSETKEWQKKHQAALKLSKELTPENSLKSFIESIKRG